MSPESIVHVKWSYNSHPTLHNIQGHANAIMLWRKWRKLPCHNRFMLQNLMPHSHMLNSPHFTLQMPKFWWKNSEYAPMGLHQILLFIRFNGNSINLKHGLLFRFFCLPLLNSKQLVCFLVLKIFSKNKGFEQFWPNVSRFCMFNKSFFWQFWPNVSVFCIMLVLPVVQASYRIYLHFR